VDVVLTTQNVAPPSPQAHNGSTKSHNHVYANMIITIWSMEDSQFYTLTFTSAMHDTASSASASDAQQQSQQSHRSTRSVTKASRMLIPAGSAASSASSSGRHLHTSSNTSSSHSSPSVFAPNFPPNGPPLRNNLMSEPSILQKSTKLRDAVLKILNIPCYAIWKDESVGIPNDALIRLTRNQQGGGSPSEFLSSFEIWTEDFSQPLGMDDYPVVQLIRTEKSTASRRVGLYDPKTGLPRLFDVNAEAITDEVSGEFVGGIVVLKDVTEYMDRIAAQKDLNAQQFEDLGDLLPLMVWTTTPDGGIDWFNQRLVIIY